MKTVQLSKLLHRCPALREEYENNWISKCALDLDGSAVVPVAANVRSSANAQIDTLISIDTQLQLITQPKEKKKKAFLI